MRIVCYEMVACVVAYTQTAEREAKDGLGSTRRQLDNDSGSDIVICSLLL